MTLSTLAKWKQMFADNSRIDIADNLTDAKFRQLRYYRNVCKRHGEMVFYTRDNSCPGCCREAAARRKLDNHSFNRARELFNELKKRAREKNIPFDLKLSEFRQMYLTAIEKPCPVFDHAFDTSSTSANDYSPSVDRFIPAKGYVLDNICIMSRKANVIKSMGTADEHQRIADWMKAVGA